MSVTATHHTLTTTSNESQGRARTITTVGQWDITARSGEDLRIVAANSSPDPEQGVVSDVYEFNRKELRDAQSSGS